MLLNLSNFELMPGSTTVMAVWPGMGKTTAAKMFEGSEAVEVIDLDSGDFKDKHNLADPSKKDEFTKRYVDEIERLMKTPNVDGKARVIMVCTTPDVTREMSRIRMIDYIAVYPYPDAASVYTEVVRARAETNPTRGNKAAAEFLLKNDKVMCERYFHEAVDVFGVRVMFVGNNVGNVWTCTYMTDIILKGLTNAKLTLETNAMIMKCLEGGTSLHINPLNFSTYLDSQGFINLRYRRRVDPCIFHTIRANAKVDAVDVIGTAYRGVDMITLDKIDAMNILRMLDTVIGDQSDKEVFGDAAISYERLHDKMMNISYQLYTDPSWPQEK